MIEPPEENKRHAAVRAVLEAIAQATPVTAGLARLYQFTHPSEFERALAQWRRDVAQALTDHETQIQALNDLIAPRLEVSETALAVAEGLCRSSENGLEYPVSFDKIMRDFPDFDRGALEEACFELQNVEFVDCSGAIGWAVRIVEPKYELFWTFDPIFMGWNPLLDSTTLASLVLADEGLADVARLQQKAGWNKRRLNPALAQIVSILPATSVSREIQPNFVTAYFAMTSRERYLLKQHVQNIGASS